jgi:hypothetical protein
MKGIAQTLPGQTEENHKKKLNHNSKSPRHLNMDVVMCGVQWGGKDESREQS